MKKLNYSLLILIGVLSIVSFSFAASIDIPNTLFSEMQKDSNDVNTWEILKCKPKKVLACEGTNCTKGKLSSIYLILNRAEKTFSRCDRQGCDTYEALFSTSGIYVNIQGKTPIGQIIKVQGKRKFVEFITAGFGGLLYQGTCKEI